jgi:hypothetical protein
LPILLAVPVVASAQSANRVYFYEHINYQGNYVVFNGIRDEPDLRVYKTAGASSPNWNDRISSIKVGDGIKLIVYQDINYKGASYTLTGPATISTLVSNGWNDRISSFRVVPE